ncbi:hypothetical protein [Vibrio crassostreae]|uniref:hypothetical protein n=1 Tax=Vibrio crassostreae TaxID=246167 RepID=UPI000F4A0350|nr:hypothetical protein [Vibrio crassostreae]ROQ71899.1 hypothetical protein EDB72_4272 [Vibrio crassostreae]ROR77285.1 hypothetical protein EDB66_4076 [Vibrio crassostreae]RPE99243.1 hypothetical protein EDB17_4253 [Vibrio crassostreae]TQL30965.1 hypothetical protein FB443_10892 [Vibrio crassostreae]
MSAICIIDTSIFLNILDVPNRNDQREGVLASFEEYIELGATFILPMATIVETGNHIAQNGDGGTRRRVARKFCEQVEAALKDEAPYKVSEFPKPIEVLTWLERFPDEAGQNKAPAKPNEGTSFGDLSIIEEFNKCVSKFSMSEVFIWSLDSDLAAYHQKRD